MEWEIVPGESIGPIIFGIRVQELEEELGVHEDESGFDGTDHWKWYCTDSRDLFIQTCNAAVVAVICERACKFRGKVLLGMSEAELRMLLADQDVVEEGVVEVGPVLEVSALGLQFGFSGGLVESTTMTVDPDRVLELSLPVSK